MDSIALKERSVKRFWSKVDVRGPDDCWEWKGTRHTKKGGEYGKFSVALKDMVAHRFSWELHFGEIPYGMLVCHKCDNPPCVNPNHLFLGTPLENSRDMVKKSRSARGERCARSRFSEEEILEIRRLLAGGIPLPEVARKYNVPRAVIEGIKRRKSWAWLK